MGFHYNLDYKEGRGWFQNWVKVDYVIYAHSLISFLMTILAIHLDYHDHLNDNENLKDHSANCQPY